MLTRLFDLLDIHTGDRSLDVALAGKSGGTWVTYSSSDYRQKARQVSCALLQLGISPGDRVAVVTNSRPEWNMLDMGLMQIGAISVPIFTTSSHEDYLYILHHAEPCMIFISEKILYNRIKPIIDDVPSIKQVYTFSPIPGLKDWQELIADGEQAETAFGQRLEQTKQQISPDDVCTIIYTSGTTGTPKGVMLTHNNLLSNVLDTVGRTSVTYGDKALSILPLSHVYERMMNYHFQYLGVSIYYVENMGTILPNMQEVQPHTLNVVPRILERIALALQSQEKSLPFLQQRWYHWALNYASKYDPEKSYGLFNILKYKMYKRTVYHKWKASLSTNLRLIICGGAPLNELVTRTISAMGIDVIEGYGLSETSPVIAVGCVTGKRVVRIGSVGTVLPSSRIKLLEDGEILVSGPNVMKGYYKDPAMTAEAIDSEGFFHTGDIGRLDEDGYLWITDRKKQLFKLSNGKYIAPQVLENKVRRSFFVDQAMTVGENQKFASMLISPNFPYLHEWCARNDISFESNEDLIALPDVLSLYQKEINAINRTLGSHEQIKRFRLVADEWSFSTGELTPTLKLKRKFIQNRYQSLIDQIYAKK